MEEEKIVDHLRKVKKGEITHDSLKEVKGKKHEILAHCEDDGLIEADSEGYHLTSDGSEFLDRKQGLNIQGKSYDLQKMKLVVAGSHILIGAVGFLAGRLI